MPTATKNNASAAMKRAKTGGRVAKSLEQKLAEGSTRSVIAAWNDDTTVDSEIAALYLGISESKLAELRSSSNQAKGGDDAAGPPLIKYFDKGAAGQNQPVLYKLRDLREFQKKSTASDSFNAALNAGLAGWTTMRQPFFAELEKRRQPLALEAPAWDMASEDREKLFASLSAGKSRIVWLTPSEAAASRWTSVAKHKAWANAYVELLGSEIARVRTALEGTEVSASLSHP